MQRDPARNTGVCHSQCMHFQVRLSLIPEARQRGSNAAAAWVEAARLALAQLPAGRAEDAKGRPRPIHQRLENCPGRSMLKTHRRGDFGSCLKCRFGSKGGLLTASHQGDILLKRIWLWQARLFAYL